MRRLVQRDEIAVILLSRLVKPGLFNGDHGVAGQRFEEAEVGLGEVVRLLHKAPDKSPGFPGDKERNAEIGVYVLRFGPFGLYPAGVVMNIRDDGGLPMPDDPSPKPDPPLQKGGSAGGSGGEGDGPVEGASSQRVGFILKEKDLRVEAPQKVHRRLRDGVQDLGQIKARGNLKRQIVKPVQPPGGLSFSGIETAVLDGDAGQVGERPDGGFFLFRNFPDFIEIEHQTPLDPIAGKKRKPDEGLDAFGFERGPRGF